MKDAAAVVYKLAAVQVWAEIITYVFARWK